MKRIFLTLAVTLSALGAWSQTLNVVTGNVTTQFPAAQAGDMTYTENGTLLTICGRTFDVSGIDRIFIDEAEVADNTVSVSYEGTSARVSVAGNVAQHVTAIVSGAHVFITQGSGVDDSVGEITYTLSGSSPDGEFYFTGAYKATVALAGLELTNPDGAAINIQNGKRIDVSIKRDTENTLTDGSGHSLKGCFVSRGHTEFKGRGVLNVYGNAANAIWCKEYVTVRNCTINVLKAVNDGLNCNQYFTIESGTVSVKNVGDDALQVSYKDDSNREAEDTGGVTVKGGTLAFTVTADGAKGIKADGTVSIHGGEVTIDQTGSIVADEDLSYPTSIKAGADISITGGTVTITNTGDGGKGLSADGAVSISEDTVATVVTITADGKGGTAELTGTPADETAEPQSYKVFVSLPTSGGQGGFGGQQGTAWKKLYLYSGDGTLVKELTSTVTKSAGYSTVTFYYHDFGSADGGTYYFKSDDYTSRREGTVAVVSSSFTAPTSGSDVYYSISNSYQTSNGTRTYSLTNVTSTYSGTSDASEEAGTGYNAAGIKADGDLTIAGGIVTVKNAGAMSKSLKSKGTATIDGGTITLIPSGAMMVINSDASYSTGVKAVDFIQNGGTLTVTVSGTAGKGISATTVTTTGGELNITNSGAAQSSGSGDYYTAKGIKADGDLKLLGGTVSISMSGNGGKGIKVNGTYSQGRADGSGPTLKVSTTGSSAGGNSGGGGGFNPWGGGMGQSSGGGSAKAIKVMNAVTIYGGTTEVSTATNGAEGLESKHSIDIRGGNHFFKCYDDCINCSKKESGATGKIFFNGGVTVCYSDGNDAVDSNAGTSGAVTIGNGAIMAYTSKGSPEEGLDCDNNAYIQITGTGYAISGGGAQGGGSSGSTISNAKQGYAFVTSSVSYQAGKYYTLTDEQDNNYVTFSPQASFSSTLSLFTAKGMVKGTKYLIKSADDEPTDAATSWHGLYLGSTAKGTKQVASFTAK